MVNSYCVRCKTHTNDVNPQMVTSNKRHMRKSKCGSCGGNKSCFTSGTGLVGKPYRARGKGFDFGSLLSAGAKLLPLLL